MRKFLCLTALLAVLSCSGPLRKTARGFRTDGPVSRFEVVCYAPDIIQVVKSPLYGEADIAPGPSVVLEPGKVHFGLERPGNGLVRLITDSLCVELNVEEGTFSFRRADGTLLLREQPEAVSHQEIHQGFLLDGNEAVYGLGQHRGSGLNQRGKEYHLENVNMEIAIPLFQSVKGYAVFWDNYSPTEFRSGEDWVSFTSEAGKSCSYFFVGGGSSDAVVRNLRTLTGQAPMNPRWAFGFHQSKERYGSQEELVGIVKRYRELGVPLDGIVQDWQYWGDNAHWNAVQFLNPQFPDPAGMMDEIHGLGAHALISVWPSFGPEADIYKELEAEGLLLPISTFPQNNGVRVYDPWNPRARDIYWDYMERNLWNVGIDAWWLDATEPEHAPVEASDYDYPTGEGRFRLVRNSFPLYSVGGVYDHQRQLTDGRRVMILTRSAAAGLQRYGAHVWSGDVVSSWTSLRDQVASALNLSLCGIPYHNSDIGGFFSAPEYPGGYEDPGFRKLYGRWMQLAAFTGMMRSHGTNTPREVFRFGERGDRDFDVLDTAIRLRYLLLPYIYTQAWRVTSEGAALMRPLFADWPADPRTWNEEEEFLFGNNLLVAPVLHEDDTQHVYLPSGGWTDFWSGRPINGGVSFDRSVPFEEVPVYVKAGTILPVGPDVQYADEKPWDDLQVRIYSGADGTFTLYEDEGDGFAYERGVCSTIPFRWDDAAGVLTIGPRHGAWPGMPERRTFRVVIVRSGIGTGLDRLSCDREVVYDGREIRVDLN